MGNQTKFKIYMRRFIGAMVLYTVGIMLYVFALNRLQENGLRFLVFMIPVVPMLFALYYQLKLFTVMDELDRRISAESWSIAAIIVGFVTFTYAFLEQAGLPKLSTFFFFPAVIAFWGIAQIFVRRRYQ